MATLKLNLFLKHRVFDVGGQKGERRKWIQVFEGISAILFLVSASEFDMKTREKHKVKRRSSRSSFKSLNEPKQIQLNRMDDSLSLFQDICESRFLECCGMICFLNKQDQLRDKIINKGYRMANYFTDYDQFDYELKVNSLTENAQDCLTNKTRYSSPIKTILKVSGKLSRQSSINSFNNLEPIRIPENNEDTDSMANQENLNQFNVNQANGKILFDLTDSNQDDKLEKRSYLNSFKSLDSIENSNLSNNVSPNLSLEYEYRKARCYIKDLFVKVAENSFEKKTRKASNHFVHNKKPKERECFFHYTIATDTNNIKKVFDDVHLMIILNNINQNMLL